MKQVWHDLLFAHWPVNPESLRLLIPPPLELQTLHSQAWIGIVPFRMSGIRLRGTPAVPGLSAFPELNVRTYVTFQGKPGVWFFSLDAASRAAVITARAWFHLPYFLAKMKLVSMESYLLYTSDRVASGSPGIQLQTAYRPTRESYIAQPGSLEHWLTERYCLYAADSSGRIYRGEIHHAPWQLQHAEASFQMNTMTARLGIALPAIPPLLHFARFQDVRAWAPRLLET